MLKKIIIHILSIQLLFLSGAHLAFAQNQDAVEVPQDVKDELADLTEDQIEVLKQDTFSDELKEFATNANTYIDLKLSDNDKEALRILGYDNDEINSLDASTFQDKAEREKMAGRLSNYADSKSSEIDKGVMKQLVPGLAASVIGLSFAALLGIVVGIRCSSVPSALAFAGTSVAWVGLEMMIWKGYNINMKDIKSLQEATKIPDKVKAKINRIKAIVEKLESTFKESGLEDYELFLAQNDAEIKELKATVEEIREYLRSQKDKQFGALKSVQKSIALAGETSRKKAKNAKIAAIGYTASAGVAAAEAYSAFGLAATCSTDSKGFLNNLFSILIPSAYASFASVGDLDKIGIPVGAGLAAAYLSFEMKFADKIYANALPRAGVFTAMAGIAFLAATKLKKAADFLDKQAHEMEVFTQTVEDAIEGKQVKFSSLSSLVISLKEDLLPKIEKIIETAQAKKEDLDQLKTMVEEGAKDIESGKIDIATEVQKKIDETVESDTGESVQAIKDQIEEAKSNFDTQIPSTDFTVIKPKQDFFDFILPRAHAASSPYAIPQSCFKRTRTFLLMDQDCSCIKDKRCAKSYFPNNLKVPDKSPFVKELVEAAMATNKANNLILSKRVDQGSKMYGAIGNQVKRIETITNQLLSKKLKTPFGADQTSKMVSIANKSTKDALREMFSSKAKQSPILSKNASLPEGVNFDLDGIKRENTRSKLREHFRLANLISRYPGSFGKKTDSKPNIDQFNYSKNTIIQDSDKDLFEVIRLRYLKIYTGHRILHIDD